jgi:short-subunit dehydrogenase
VKDGLRAKGDDVKELQGRVALVTGASGGIGTHIARALAAQGMDVVVSGRREDALAEVVRELEGTGVRAAAVPADLGDLDQIDPLVERSEAALGPIDVLVNNAGIETASAFHKSPREELMSMVDVNLTAPMLLTRRVLPGMLERDRGHVVFISSVAGKIGPAFNEPYAATKGGLVRLTQSLRAEYDESPVGFSVVCPGFVAGDGMYQRMKDSGIRSNRIMGETTTEKVASGVVRAIRRDLPQVIDGGSPVRPLLAIGELSPRLLERVVRRSGAKQLFRKLAKDRGRL